MRIRLEHKILSYSGLAVTLLLTGVVGFMSVRLESTALEQSLRSLDRVARAIDLLADARFQRRRTTLVEWASSSSVAGDSSGSASARADHWISSSPRHDFLFSLSSDGSLLAARPDSPSVAPAVLASVGPTNAALRGVGGFGLWNLDGRFFDVIAIPVAGHESGASVVVAGNSVGEIVEEIHSITGAEVVLLAGDSIVESTLPKEVVSPMLRELSPGSGEDPRLLSVGGERYLVSAHDVRTDLGEGACRHIILQPVGGILQPSRKAVREVALLGLIAWLGLFLLAALGSRGITRPLARLTQAMAGMADQGVVRTDFPTCGGGYEVTVLEETFRGLSRSLSKAEKDRERCYREAIAAVVVALEARDQGTYGHSLRVAAYATRLAGLAGFPEERMASVEWGALLHDVGKIAVPDLILQKAGPLDEAEWRIMKRHPEWGREIVSRVAFLLPALPVVSSHHESWDGSGYPGGLSEREIPIEARIFAVVDTYDAITSARPYRQERSHSEAVKELHRVAGRQLDPDLVDIFCSIPAQELATIRREVAEALGSDTEKAIFHLEVPFHDARQAN